ncbi:MAG TPA: hypothetical protein ENI87_07805 [bacterium]|nr:hypothetical protein [bacterium]
MTEAPRVTAPGANAPVAETSPGSTVGAAGSPRFEELLERLVEIARQQPAAEEVDSPERLQEALRTADDGFVAAMDLRRRLEDAFRRHQP